MHLNDVVFGVLRLLRLSLLIALLATSLFPVVCQAQVSSNEGMEFWVAFPTHEHDYAPNGTIALPNLSIFITSSGQSSGTINVGSFSSTFNVEAGGVSEIQIPRNQAYIDESESGKILNNRAIHIKVNEHQAKIVVYAHIFAAQRSAASLILPTEALGKEYLSTNFKSAPPAKNFITLVAIQANTRIYLKKAGRELVEGGVSLPNAGDVYEFTSDEDLTGTKVTTDGATCNNFAMFSGSSGSVISDGTCTAKTIDPLYQQCYPVKSWGFNYGVVPFSTSSPQFDHPVRTTGYHIRVIAKDDHTAVSINGVKVATLHSGGYYTSELTGPLTADCFISADKPISVAQYALSEACSNQNSTGGQNGYSDPDMVILNPIEYNIKQITIFSSTKEDISEQYVNLLIKTTATQSFRVNNEKPASPFRPMKNLPGFSFLQLDLTGYPRHTFTLKADEGFNAIAYGFGKVESYAYSAGTNLATDYTLLAIKRSSQQIIDSACVDDDYYFKLTLPYAAPKIIWQMDKSESAFTDLHPVFTKITDHGANRYEYLLPKTAAYNRAGYHDIHVKAFYPEDECSNTATQDIRQQFKVVAPPDINIKVSASACPQTFEFEDLSETGQNQKTWAWDFGDPENPNHNKSSQKKTSHNYSKAGSYIVTLMVKNDIGCTATQHTTVVVKDPAFAVIAPSPGMCVGRPVVFSDASIPNAGFAPVRWAWYFGDGDSTINTNGAPIHHYYKTAGNYRAQLVLTSDAGCESYSPAMNIPINALPAGDFDVQDICTGGTAIFKLKESPSENLKITWNFGDPYAGANNPNDADMANASHTYSHDGEYPVSLKLTSPDGCDSTIVKNIHVMSNQIMVDFSTENTCAGQPTTFRNLSTITGYGIFSKIEWYFDFEKLPDQKEVYLYPANNQTCLHSFLLPEGTLERQVKVKLKVFTAGDCYQEITKTITVSALPQVGFDQPAPVCIDSPPFYLTGAKENSGITGYGFFKGRGVAPDGMFDPAGAGPGLHSLTYVFVSNSGCTDSASRQISVLSKPIITQTVNEVTILQGQKIKLVPAVKQEQGLFYEWTPTFGLDNNRLAAPEASPEKKTIYTLAVSNGKCTSFVSYTVNVLKPIVTINAFSPNADGINDTWIIGNIGDYPNATIRIFNRYGTELYHSKGNVRPWDGRYAGKNLPAGVYYFLILPGENLPALSGNVALLR